jgi:hypothetical protein
MRVIAACALASIAAGCAAKPSVTSDQERNDAMLALDACLHSAARSLDDGRSEADTIALGLRPSCAAQFVLSRDVYASQLNAAAAQLYHRTDDQAFMQLATAAVLAERAKQRQ